LPPIGFHLAGKMLQVRTSITGRIALVASVVLTSCTLIPVDAHAQDIPGIEICTVEKTMERRTSCLQSNVDFLQKTITKLAADHQQKLDAATRQIEALKAGVASLQKNVDDLQAAQKKALEDQKKKTDAPPAAGKDSAAPAAKDGAK
jgi:prefoldin subunit 5